MRAQARGFAAPHPARTASKAPRKRPEQALQIAVAKYLALALRPPTFWTSIDHGAGKMTRASAGLRKARGVKAGIPDVIVMHPFELSTLVIGIELKADKGSLSPAQKQVREELRGVNARYIKCKSLDDVSLALRAFGVPVYGRPSSEQARVG